MICKILLGIKKRVLLLGCELVKCLSYSRGIVLFSVSRLRDLLLRRRCRIKATAMKLPVFTRQIPRGYRPLLELYVTEGLLNRGPLCVV